MKQRYTLNQTDKPQTLTPKPFGTRPGGFEHRRKAPWGHTPPVASYGLGLGVLGLWSEVSICFRVWCFRAFGFGGGFGGIREDPCIQLKSAHAPRHPSWRQLAPREERRGRDNFSYWQPRPKQGCVQLQTSNAPTLGDSDRHGLGFRALGSGCRV